MRSISTKVQTTVQSLIGIDKITQLIGAAGNSNNRVNQWPGPVWRGDAVALCVAAIWYQYSRRVATILGLAYERTRRDWLAGDHLAWSMGCEMKLFGCLEDC